MSALDPAEWDFSKVSDDEIRYAYLYEFSREAERARWDFCRKLEEASMLQASDDFTVARAAAKTVLDLKKHELSFGAVTPLFQTLRGGLADEFGFPSYLPPPPWQTLNETERKNISDFWMQAIELRPAREALRVHSWSLETFSRPLSLPVSLEGGGDVLANVDGSASMVISVDLQNRPDSEIISDFEKSLRRLRVRLTSRTGNDYDGPGKAGTKVSSWRSNLDNLGLIRLRHRLPLGELIGLIAQSEIGIEVSFAGRESASKAIDKRRESGLRVFRRVCQNLGPGAFPESWDPAAMT